MENINEDFIKLDTNFYKDLQKQISLRIDAKQLKEMKQYCLDHNTNMTTAIKMGLFLLQHSTQENGKIKAEVEAEALKQYAGIEL